MNTKSGELQILSFVTDITDQKKSEFLTHNYRSKIASSEKNNIMDELLNKVVQELNQPIGVINNYIQGVIRRLENGKCDDTSILDVLRKTIQQCYRASDIILRVKNFNYRGEFKFELTSINALIQDTITLINYEIIDYPVTIYNRSRVGNLQVKVDKIHIQQVLLNLVRNAIEAMKDAESESPKLIIEASKISSKFIEICVIDNGPAFDKKDIHQLMDPNFTTKSYGVGLGLAICRRIIETHQGKLSIELNPTTGACFKFTLPI